MECSVACKRLVELQLARQLLGPIRRSWNWLTPAQATEERSLLPLFQKVLR